MICPSSLDSRRARRLLADLLVGGAFVAVVSTSTAEAAGARTQVPPAAVKAGYLIETFSSRPPFSRNIDTSPNPTSSGKWLLWNFLGVEEKASSIKPQPDGSVVIASTNNGTITSARKLGEAPFFKGVAFGCGAYFEATFSFDPTLVDLNRGWPSWWKMSIEHLIGKGEQWKGRPPGYDHFFELDTFEYNRASDDDRTFGFTVSEWYGIWGRTCGALQYCVNRSPYADSTLRAPPGTDWTKPHKFASLWRPSRNGAAGEFSFFLDDVQVGPSIKYVARKDSDPEKHPDFGVADRQHLVMILGSGSAPMRIYSAHVWQGPEACNLVN